MDARCMNQFDDNGKPPKKGKKGKGKPSNKKGIKSVGQGNKKPSKEGKSRKSLGRGGKENTMDSRRMNQSDGNREGTSRISDDESEEDIICGLWKRKGSDRGENRSSNAERTWFLSHTHECFSSSEDDVPVVRSYTPPFFLVKGFIAEDPFNIDKACPTEESLEDRIKRISLASDDSDPDDWFRLK